MSNWRSTPIFITNFNNLDRGFVQLLAWLRAARMENVTVLDNGSTWPPLLDLYQRSPELQVIQVGSNRGPYAFWHLGLQDQQLGQFIVTDPDVVPAATCPYDLVHKMLEVAWCTGSPVKVGPSLRIDNLPDHYRYKQDVLSWEKQFWEHTTVKGDAYDAQLDTTMALYQPGMGSWPKGARYLRLAPPYQLEHIPWYEDSSRPSEEAIYYAQHLDPQWTHWSRQGAAR